MLRIYINKTKNQNRKILNISSSNTYLKHLAKCRLLAGSSRNTRLDKDTFRS